MKHIRTDSRKYLWYGRRPIPRRSIPRMRAETETVLRDVLSLRYPPLDIWFDDDESFHGFFEETEQ